jgi:hypothetical protein
MEVGGKSAMKVEQETATMLPRPILQWKEGDNHHNMNSPHKVKDVSFDQHRETVPDNPSCQILSLWQVTEVFQRRPDCVAQCKDFPHKKKVSKSGESEIRYLPVWKSNTDRCRRE